MAYRVNTKEQDNWGFVLHSPIPLQDSWEGAHVMVANDQPHRVSYLAQHPYVKDTTIVGSGHEPRSKSAAVIAATKVRNALSRLEIHQPDQSIHAIIGQDTQNEGFARPADEDVIRTHLSHILERGSRSGKYSYIAETATALLNGSFTVQSIKFEFELNPDTIRRLIQSDSLFAVYLDACKEFAHVSAIKVAGGLCFEALLVMNAITTINGLPLGEDRKSTEKLIQHSLFHVLCGYPPTLLALLHPTHKKASQHPEQNAVLGAITSASKVLTTEGYPSLR